MRKISLIILVSLVIGIGIGLIGNQLKMKTIKDVKREDNMIFTALPKKRNTYYNSFYNDLVSFNQHFNQGLEKKDKLEVITTQKLTQQTSDFAYNDIWIRDVAPVVTNRLVKFRYSPEYLDEKESQKLDRTFRKWLERNQFEYHSSPLILDGGNCVWDKKETVIMTDRVLSDNASLSKEEIVKQLKKDLQITNVIIIPTETGDILSHADGMVKFIGENTLFISDFLGDVAFQKEVATIIYQTLPTIKIVEMASSYVEEGQYDEEIASAKGLYINMLETEGAIYVPQFNLPKDKNQLDFVRKYTDKEVIPIAVNELSTMGGAVNCLTWYCPKEFLPI